MKSTIKISIMVLGLAAMTFACGPKKETAESTEDTTTTEVMEAPVADSTVVDSAVVDSAVAQ